MERLVIIDGNAILHRAYHALPKLTNKEGELTNAVYGFASMLLKVISDLKPSYLVVTFDRPAPTFRKKLFKDYQATRPKMEENLSSQIEMVHNLVSALGIPTYELDGYEADDVIGTITRKVDGSIEKIIVTGDRDILQLVNQHTKVYMPVKGLSEAKLFGEEEVKEKMGVIPKTIVDLKALTGDPSDNYPGVSGIGPKTAITLLQKFNTLENIYSNINNLKISGVSEKVISSLVAGKNDAQISKTLATIVTNVPISFNLKQTEISKDGVKFSKVFSEFGFETLAKRASNNQQITYNKKQETKKENDQLGLF